MRIEGGNALDHRWWPDPGGEPAYEPGKRLVAWAEELRKRQYWRYELDVIHHGLYEALPSAWQVAAATMPNPRDVPFTFNVVRAVIDTLVSRVARSKLRPFAQTSGASWKLQREAKKLTRWIDGSWYTTRFFPLRREALRHACVFGTGLVKGYVDSSGPALESAFGPEVFVDDAEAKYGAPRTIVQLRTIDRRVAAATLAAGDAELRDRILSAQAARRDYGWGAEDSSRDQIDVYEGWHLPSGPDAGDSAHVIAGQGFEVLVEPWDLRDRANRVRFPFAELRHGPGLLGWYGTGLARTLTGKQLEINAILARIQQAFRIASNMQVFVERGSRVIRQHFNNEIGNVLEYSGVAPIFHVAQTVHPEVFQHLLWLIESSFREAGINAMTAAGQKDPTLKSGRAQEVALDVEDSRFADFMQADEEFSIDAAELMLELARRSGKAQEVMWTGARGMAETLRLNEIELPTNKFVLQIFGTSGFSRTTAARLEQAEGALNAGAITMSEWRRLQGMPDTDASDDLANAWEDAIRARIEAILSDGWAEYEDPLPLMPLDRAMQIAVQYYARSLLYEDVPESHREALLAWITEIDHLQAPPPAAQAAGAPGMPPPAPMPQPPPNGAPPGTPIQ